MEKVYLSGHCCILEVRVMTAEDLVERYAAGERLFIEVDLSGVDLSGVSLPEVKLHRCNLQDSDLSGINLLGGSLMGSNLSGTNLSSANLERVAMQGTNLENAILLGAETVEVEFAGAFFHNTIDPEGYTIEGPEYFD